MSGKLHVFDFISEFAPNRTKIIIVIVVITILTLIMIMMTMEVEPLRNLYLEEVTTEDIVHLEESILDME